MFIFYKDYGYSNFLVVVDEAGYVHVLDTSLPLSKSLCSGLYSYI